MNLKKFSKTERMRRYAEKVRKRTKKGKTPTDASANHELHLDSPVHKISINGLRQAFCQEDSDDA